ncbi:lipid droplet-regulating VLDL assembly factor AUP1-like isoform X2 [Ptychodera flava]|uniref:lipid droplet-regulating VLDL assembly factor AUP1-like isoform X2 n=1 Tax=Ptychodera flava TaxID=63121 RepID=UPI00396A1D75
MGSPEIAQLFDNSRFQGGGSLVVIFFYFPLGLVLALLRIFIGLQVFLISCILPKFLMIRSFVLRVMCGVLGLVITTEGVKNRERDAPVLVTNHISPLDHLAVDLVFPSIMPSVWDLPWALMWALGYRDMGAKRGREVLIQKAKEHCEENSVPLLTHPEGATTNGKKALLKFSTWPFSLDQPVQPIVITVKRPLIGINTSTLGSRWWQDVFWFFFSPFSVFHLRVLPVMALAEPESVDEFTKKVQGLMAKELNMVTTNYTSADKVEYAKKVLFTPPRRNIPPGAVRRTQPPSQSQQSARSAPSSRFTSHSSSSGSSNDRLSIMTKQVQEVLPHVPAEVIQKDLYTTQCVDTTITNILEERVQFTPVDFTPPSSSKISEDKSSDGQVEGATAAVPLPHTSKLSTESASATKFSAKSFSRSTNERQMSFQERKKALYDTARRRYKEKHGLL